MQLEEAGKEEGLTPARTSKSKLVLVAALALLAGGALLAFLLWPSAGGNTTGGDGTQVTVVYTLPEGAEGLGAPPNSPLEVRVRLPWRAGDNSTIFSSVGLEFLDENGSPAQFGSGTIGPVDMKPALDVAEWFYLGSTPSKPGLYHARLTLRRLFGSSEPETVVLRDPTYQVTAESGSPLSSGYVFDSGSDLWLLSTDGTRQRRITFFGSQQELASDPVWSPDGMLIAFTYANHKNKSALPSTEIRVMRSDGTGMVTVATASPDREVAYPSWSMDGTHLYFTVKRPDPSTPQPITHVERVTPGTRERTQVLPSGTMARQLGTDGALVYIEERVDPQSGAVQQRIVRSDEDGELRQALVDEGVFPAIYAPRPSPDGKWIAFSAVNPDQPRAQGFDFWDWLTFQPTVAEAHGAPWDIYMVPADGGMPERLTTIQDDEPRITWLDNTTLAFMGIKGLHTLKLTPQGKPAGEPARIHTGSDHGGLSWHGP
jgi:Tol biopolymer transport system component